MNNKKYYLLMYFAFFIYSLSGIISKLASHYAFLSFSYIVYFSVIVLILGVYALLWQQVLKQIPLSVAMSNKPIVLILGIIWAILFFKEIISLKFIIGVFFILCGILIIGFSNNEK